MIGQIHTVKQNSPEWDKLRAGRFTASAIDCLFSLPKTKAQRTRGELSATATKYIRQVARECYTGKPTANKLSEVKAIQFGNLWEDTAIDWYQALTGNNVSKVGFVSVGDLIGCSPDLIINDYKKVGEVKCHESLIVYDGMLRIRTSEQLKRVHRAYWHQLQMNMWSVGAESGHFISFCPAMIEDESTLHMAMHIIEVERDHSIDWKGILRDACIHLANEFDVLDRHSQYMKQFISQESQPAV